MVDFENWISKIVFSQQKYISPLVINETNFNKEKMLKNHFFSITIPRKPLKMKKNYFWDEFLTENRIEREVTIPSHGSQLNQDYSNLLFKSFLTDLCFACS